MAFDGIVLKQVISELNTCLINGKINKIYEPNKNEILLGIYSNRKNYALNINISSNYYRLHLTTTSKPNPINAPNFCMVLRKHIIGSIIKEISISSLERIVTINLEGYNELNDIVNKKLIIELMGKHSNIILVNENNIIIDSLRHLDSFSNSYRDILPAHEYVLPSSDKKDIYSSNVEDFISCVNNNISKSISENYTGISNIFVNTLLEKLNISNTSFSKDDLIKVYSSIENILNGIGKKECIFVNNNSDYTISCNNTNELLQTNFFLDDFYNKKEQNDILSSYKNQLLKLVLSSLKRISKKISNINEKIKECDNIDNYRIYGELITSNLYKLDKDINMETITLENYYNNNEPITIKLDNTISISYNAKKFFKKYHKLKNTLNIVTLQKKEAQNELDYLESIIFELENANSIYELDDIYSEISENIFSNNKNTFKSVIKKNKENKKKINNEYEPIIYKVDGFTLYIGKNNKQNDYITTKLGKNEDIWFHTKDIRGSHGLLKCNGSEVNLNTIISCAQIVAYHSKAKLSSNVPVDYCFIRDVKKPSGSKPGMVIYKNNKTLNVNPKIAD